MFTDRIGRHEVLLLIYHKNYNFREKKNNQFMKKGKFWIKILTKRRKWFHVTLKLRLFDLNYNFECDWLIELSDNNLAGELVENRSCLNQSQSRKHL